MEGPAESPKVSARTQSGETETRTPQVAEVESRQETSPSTVPPPRLPTETTVRVAVGLGPEAPGSKAEKAILADLEASVRASTSPRTTTRRLRPGVGDGASVCRERLDDLVILVGYVPARQEPVLLTYDCSLRQELGIRAQAAASEPILVATLWREHQDLIAAGARERGPGVRLGNRARVGIIAGVTLVLVGTAIGLLVAGALRDQTVVLTVAP